MRSMTLDAAVERFATDVGESGPVAVEGNRTRWNVGGQLAPDARVLTAPSGIVNYQPAEMTMQVLAGTTLAELNAALAEANQQVALPSRGGTVGGAIAVGENPLRVLRHGRLRASVLRVSYVSAEGRVIVGGGNTVKNVTGFDLPRLMTGSLGTLGLFGEFILRTNPIDPATKILTSTDAEPFAILDQVLRPNVVLWDGTSTWVELAGHQADVDQQRAKLDRIGTWAPSDSLPDLPSHRWSLQPAQIRSLDTSATGRFVASVGVGTVFAERPQPVRVLGPGLAEVANRMKQLFDPTGRLNPGRNPGQK